MAVGLEWDGQPLSLGQVFHLDKSDGEVSVHLGSRCRAKSDGAGATRRYMLLKGRLFAALRMALQIVVQAGAVASVCSAESA